MTKRTLIAGITGQDGASFAEFLAETNYQVRGTVTKQEVVFPSYLASLGGRGDRRRCCPKSRLFDRSHALAETRYPNFKLRAG